MSKTIEIKRKPVMPIYLAGALWVVGALVLPIYKLWALVATALISGAGYLIARRICPPIVELKEVGFLTGSEDADKMLTQIFENRNQLKVLNDRIPDEALSEAISRMEKACDGILEQLEKDTSKAPALRRFTNHYLPDAVKILSLYANLTQNDVRGENTAQVQKEVKENAGIIAAAFEHQYDSLFASDALDMSTDLEVLKGMLKGQGLV